MEVGLSLFYSVGREILLCLTIQNHITWPPLAQRGSVGKTSLGIPGNILRDDPEEGLRVGIK